MAFMTQAEATAVLKASGRFIDALSLSRALGFPDAFLFENDEAIDYNQATLGELAEIAKKTAHEHLLKRTGEAINDLFDETFKSRPGLRRAALLLFLLNHELSARWTELELATDTELNAKKARKKVSEAIAKIGDEDSLMHVLECTGYDGEVASMVTMRMDEICAVGC